MQTPEMDTVSRRGPVSHPTLHLRVQGVHTTDRRSQTISTKLSRDCQDLRQFLKKRAHGSGNRSGRSVLPLDTMLFPQPKNRMFVSAFVNSTPCQPSSSKVLGTLETKAESQNLSLLQPPHLDLPTILKGALAIERLRPPELCRQTIIIWITMI